MSNIRPSSAYRELGRLLLEIREASGLSAAELARGLEWSTTMVSRMENGRRISTTPDVVMYVVKCGLTLREAMPLVELCRIAERKQGYYLSDPRIGGSLQSLIFIESLAEHSIIYEPLVVHGLLQIPSYARARLIAVEPDITDSCMAGATRTRIERQRILSLSNPGRFTFYIHEQALRIRVGSDAIMHEQLLHIVFTAALNNVTVRIVPSGAGERSVFGGAFHLMEFEEYRPVVYLDSHTGGLIIEDRDHVRGYHELLPMLADIALDEGQSREFAADLADAYDRGSQDGVADVLAEEQLQQRGGIELRGGGVAKEQLQRRGGI